ncbi:hypothetical protein [Phaeobacter sp. JH209A]|uniref:hypothetical protein n=1 Tax=Phaeobacter sp. JH209A TaxID=3112505 RepID=UPI003A855BF7
MIVYSPNGYIIIISYENTIRKSTIVQHPSQTVEDLTETIGKLSNAEALAALEIVFEMREHYTEGDLAAQAAVKHTPERGQ